MATLVCMTGSDNLLGKTATKCRFYKLNSLHQNILFFLVISCDFVVVGRSLQKIIYKRKKIIKEIHTTYSILVMGGVGIAIASQIRKIIDFWTISLVMQKQFPNNTCLHQVLHFIKMCFGLKCREV